MFSNLSQNIMACLIFTFLSAILILLNSSAFAQGKHSDQGMWGPSDLGWWKEWHGKHMLPWHKQRMRRHWRFMHGELPAKYKKLTNPVKPNKENISSGAKLYQNNCAQCHGKSGMGDGKASKNLRPSPALLAYLIQSPVAADSYLMWTISEGGAANKTDMPAFKEVLSKDEIWKIILYLHAGLPGTENKK